MKQNNATPQQKEAIYYRGKNVLVFASAGGGKTKVLIDRLVSLILEDHVSLDRIVAITFTEAAAGNMRKRLAKALDELLREQPHNDYLRQQRTLLTTAHITTIHGFCLQIIHEFGYIIGLSSSLSQNVLAEGKRQQLLKQSMEEILQEEEYEPLFSAISKQGTNLSELCELLQNCLYQAEAYPDPLQWFQKSILSPAVSYEEIPQEMRHYYFASCKKELQILCFRLQDIIQFSPEPFAEEWRHYLALLADLKQEENYVQFIQKARLLPKIPGLLKAKEFLDIASLYKEKRDDVATLLKDFAQKLEDPGRLLENYNRSLPFVRQLLELSATVYQRFLQHKQALPGLDFSDFEHYAYQILQAQNGYVAKLLQERYQEIMVDEFQDTSSTQYALISSLSHHNLFLVGDIKQSIYRFRNAKPAIMKQLITDPSFHQINIPSNFRSNKNIVEFNNQFFSQLMNIDGNNYSEKDYQEAPQDWQAKQNVQIRFVHGITQEKDEKKRRALYLCQEVLRAYREGVAWEKMAVILRNHAEEKDVCKAFENLHIPYVISKQEHYFNSFSLHGYLGYLRYLLEPNNNNYRVAVLRNFYHKSDDELWMLKQQHFHDKQMEKDAHKLRKIWKEEGLLALLQNILFVQDFYSRLPEEEKINLDYFMQQFPSYDLHNLWDVVDYVDSVRYQQKETASDVSEESPVVKIMTIHHAKGLEFDTVFFLMNHEDKIPSKNLVSDEQLGIGFRYYLGKEEIEPLTRKAIIFKNEKEEIAERQRLLYVAFTRAKRQLVLLDVSKDSLQDFGAETLLLEGKGFTSYVRSLMGTSPLICIEEIQEEPQCEAFIPDATTKVEPLPPYHYESTKAQRIVASSLENQEDKLDLNAIQGMEYGTRIHHLFEQIRYEEPFTIEKYCQENPDLSPHEISIIASFMQHPFVKEWRKNHQFHQEYSYYFQKDKQLYHGFMDLVAMGEKDIILIDYKTDRGRSDDELKYLYTPQQEIYAEILRHSYPHAKLQAYLFLTGEGRFLALDI